MAVPERNHSLTGRLDCARPLVDFDWKLKVRAPSSAACFVPRWVLCVVTHSVSVCGIRVAGLGLVREVAGKRRSGVRWRAVTCTEELIVRSGRRWSFASGRVYSSFCTAETLMIFCRSLCVFDR